MSFSASGDCARISCTAGRLEPLSKNPVKLASPLASKFCPKSWLYSALTPFCPSADPAIVWRSVATLVPPASAAL